MQPGVPNNESEASALRGSASFEGHRQNREPDPGGVAEGEEIKIFKMLLVEWALSQNLNPPFENENKKDAESACDQRTSRTTSSEADTAERGRKLVTSLLSPSLADKDLSDLRTEVSLVRLKAGEILFEAGDPGDALYVVRFGRLRALLPDGQAQDHLLGDIGRGETVGEMALLTGETRAATVGAVRDTELIKLTRRGFELLMAKQSGVMFDLTRLIIARYRRTIHPAAENQPLVFAVVPSSPEIPTADFVAGLARALSPGRRVCSVDSGQIPSEYRGQWAQSSISENGELTCWLHELERQHDYLVYSADPHASPWTRLCVRQADVVLILAAGATPRLEPQLMELVRGPQAGRVRKELVLLYDGAQRMPGNTAQWLASIAVSSHHHLDLRRRLDYERLARMLTGQAVGLVLGGGGARGLAHIGVIRALEEAGIAIDRVGGTSIGAIIAGQLALGWDSARMQSESRRLLVEAGSLNDFTLPMMALLRGRRYIRMLDTLFGDRRIEDALLPYFCVSTNLTSGDSVVHSSGRFRKWVAASMAIPGLGPPVFHGREILVDGGLLNVLPVDVMRSLGRGSVFASSVSPPERLELDREYRDFPSPWRVLLSRLNPFATPIRVPSIAGILMSAASLPRVTPSVGQGEQTADLVFEPPVAGHKLLDWHSLDELVEIGYRSAVETIAKWPGHSPPRSQPPADQASFPQK